MDAQQDATPKGKKNIFRYVTSSTITITYKTERMNAHAANSMSRKKKCQSGGKLDTLDKLS
jgi:hypothetical protein